jgi:hypothetical protein
MTDLDVQALIDEAGPVAEVKFECESGFIGKLNDFIILL